MDTQKMQSQLYRVEEMPEHFHELYIESGYRSPYSTASQCIKSIFLPTNETLNVWTHLMPGLYFWWVLYLLSQEISFIDDPYMWPMFAYMVSVCLFPIASALAHIFNTMSDTARHTCFFIDYMALSLYSLGAAIAYNAYIFPKSLMGTTFAKCYLPIAVVNAVVSMVMMCETRFMEHGIRKKILRLCSLGIPYMFDSLPVIYRIIYCEAGDCDSNALWLHTRQFGLAFSAAALYSSHMPERLRPGVFDIIGHSHQLFHICSVLGSYDQMRGLLLDAQERRDYLMTHVPPSTFSGTVGLLAVVAVIDLIILLLFTRRLCLTLQSVNDANYSLTHHKVH